MSQTVNLGHVVGPGVPSGGTAGQILKKNSGTNFDTSWVDNTAEITEMSSSDDRTVAQAIGSVEASIAIVVNGNNAPQNLSVGQYIFLKNHSTLPSGGRHVTASISSGSAITSNNTAADSDGIANALNSKITKHSVAVTNINNSWNGNTVYANDSLIFFDNYTKSIIHSSTFPVHIGTLASADAPSGERQIICPISSSGSFGGYATVSFASDGKINIESMTNTGNIVIRTVVNK